MAAGDVAELVRDHALELVDIVGRLEQARLDVDRLAGRDEGVDLGIVEKHDLDAVRVEPRRLDQRPRDVLEQRLGLGVAEDLQARNPLSSWAAAGCQPANASMSASISRRMKRETGDFIAPPLTTFGAERGMKTKHSAQGG